MSTTPLVRDEQIYKRVDEYTLPYRTEITRVTKEFRDIYEAELQSLRARIIRMEEAGNAMRDQLESIANVGGWPNNETRPLTDAWDAAISNN